MRWLLRFLFGWTLPLLRWIEPSFTGNDNKASGRKVSAFVFMFLIVSTTSKLLMKDDISIFHIYLLAILVCTFLLLQGIITVQNIVDIWKNGNPKDPEPPK